MRDRPDSRAELVRSLALTEETFGPLAAIRAVADDAEALRVANALPFGLAAYVYSGDLERAWTLAEKIEAVPSASTSTTPASSRRLSAAGR